MDIYDMFGFVVCVATALCRRGIRDNEDNSQDGGLPEMAMQCLCHTYHLHAKNGHLK